MHYNDRSSGSNTPLNDSFALVNGLPSKVLNFLECTEGNLIKIEHCKTITEEDLSLMEPKVCLGNRNLRTSKERKRE